jgi:hypothetical protein
MAQMPHPPESPRSALLESTKVARDRSFGVLMDGVRSAGVMAEFVKGLSASQTYTVVFRGAAKGSLHQAQAGLFEAAVRNGSGRYVQRVLLKPTGAAFAGAIAAVAVQIALAEITSRLDRLQASIDRLRDELKARQKGNILGALRLLELIHLDREPTRGQTLVTVRATLNQEFATACGNARDQIARLHDPHDTSVFNVFTSAREQALAGLSELRSEVSFALCCAEGLAQAEFHLNGSEAAAEVLSKLVSDLQRLPLRDVQDKARRVDIERGEEPPDRFWIDLEHMLEVAARETERLMVDGPHIASVQVSGSDLLQIAAAGEGSTAAA